MRTPVTTNRMFQLVSPRRVIVGALVSLSGIAIFSTSANSGVNNKIAARSVIVDSFNVERFSDHEDLVLHTNRAPVFQSRSKLNPNVLVVDVMDAESKLGQLKSPGGSVTGIAVENRRGQNGQKLARLTVKLNEEVQYRVGAEKREVRVSIYPGATDKKAKLSNNGLPLTRLAQSEDAGASFDDDFEASGAKMTFVGFRDTAQESRVFARLSEEAEFNVKKEGSSVVVMEIQGASIPLRNNKNHLDATFFESPVKVITPSEVDGDPSYIRITIEMKEDVTFEARREGREVAVYFAK